VSTTIASVGAGPARPPADGNGGATRARLLVEDVAPTASWWAQRVSEGDTKLMDGRSESGKTTLFSGWGDWQSSEPTLRSAYRGVTRLGMPWVGRSVMWLVYRGSPGGAENSKSRTSTARAITDSSIEKCCPMHPRGPPPNGHHA
jgi:hypothetical protein